jgi:hypothetical protein
MSSTEERRMNRVRRRLTESAIRLMESLDDETITNAPLNQRAAALGIVLDRLMKLYQVAEKSRPQEEEVIRLEYQYPDGSIHHAPPWANDNYESDTANALHGSSLWEAFRKDGGGEALID